MRIKTKKPGIATLSVSGKYKNNDPVTEAKVVTVTQDLNLNTPTHFRDSGYSGLYSITGVKIVNPFNSLEVGEERVLIGYVLPAYWLQDNNIKWSSSDPEIASIAFGVVTAHKTGSVRITCEAIGTEFTDHIDITVTPAIVQTFAPSEIYTPDPPEAMDAVTVTNWLVQALETAKNGNYKKIVIPRGEVYHLTPEAVLGSDTSIGTTISRTAIYIPSDLVVDLNGNTFQVDRNVWTFYNTGSGTQGGYNLIAFGNGSYLCKNSAIVNGTILGEVEQLSTRYDGNEHTNIVSFNNAYKCRLENCTVGNSPGFNIHTSISAEGGIGSPTAYVKYQFVEAGGFDHTGNKVDAPLSWRTTTRLKVNFNKDLSPYYCLGSVWGKTAEFIDATLYDIIWYDSAGKVIEADFNNLVYYCYIIPDNAVEADVVIHQKDKPTESNGLTSYCFAPLFHALASTYCTVKNCLIKGNTSTGIALVGGMHNIVDGNTFESNGYRDPSSHIDMEDNGDTMHGTIIKNNTFSRDSGYVLFIVGRNVAVHNNVFDCFTRGARCYEFRIWGNTFNWGSTGDFVYSGNNYFAYNIGKGYNPKPRNAPDHASFPGNYRFFSWDNILPDGSPNIVGTSLNK